MSTKFISFCEPFGFGPVSKLSTICRNLKKDFDVKIDFIGTDVSYDFIDKNSQPFNQIFNNIDQIEWNQYDLALNVMHPEYGARAAISEVPLYTIDSLFWFWQWDKIEKIAKKGGYLSIDSHDRLTYEQKIFNTHCLSKFSFLQHYPSASRDDTFRQKIGNYEIVNPIVDMSSKSNYPPSDRVIVSLCGQMSPYVTEEMAVKYSQSVVDLVGKYVSELDINIVITGNETILDQIETKYPNSQLNHIDMLKLIDQSSALICPPSITSLFEASLYETPVFLLPEQNVAHWKSYQALESNMPVENVFPGVLLGKLYSDIRDLPEENTDKIYEKLSDSMADGTLDKQMSKEAPKLKEFFEEDTKEKHLKIQSDALFGSRARSNGVDNIIQRISNDVQGLSYRNIN
jgi:hypothetical protein